MADSLVDIEVDGDDIVYDTTNDLSTVEGVENVKQTVALSTLDATRELVGSPISPRKVRRLEAQIEQSLDDDPQIGAIKSVSITNIDKPNDTVEVNVQCLTDEDFELPLSA